MSKLTPQSQDFSEWYNEIVLTSEMADYSPVRGCMVIRPYGYALWENMQKNLDRMFKETGHQNLYFPLFIPESLFKKEAEHIEGFSPECAVVTIGGGEKLDDPLIIRPTSETIIWSMYKKWINSYADLPLLYNQWANVVRWEMRTRLFLRTTEFLWQEGHTAHVSLQEAEEEALKMLEIYRVFSEEYMAIPAIKGIKTDAQKFAGALRTYCIEAMMGDKKALQAGTSHNLGQNFAKAFDVTFQNREGEREYVWATSWGVSTRLIGAIIMAHGDTKGLRMPPKLAPVQTVVIPIYKDAKEKESVLSAASRISSQLLTQGIRAFIDSDEKKTPGWKFNQWEMKGVPLRIEVGPTDVDKHEVTLVRRDTGEKMQSKEAGLNVKIGDILQGIQQNLFNQAQERQQKNTHKINEYRIFKEQMEEGGFILSHWCTNRECEKKIQEETKATIRLIPFDQKPEKGKCIYCGDDSHARVVFARAY